MSLNHHSNSKVHVLLFIFYKWKHWKLKKLSDLYFVIQKLSNRIKIWIEVCLNPNLHGFIYSCYWLNFELLTDLSHLQAVSSIVKLWRQNLMCFYSIVSLVVLLTFIFGAKNYFEAQNVEWWKIHSLPRRIIKF